MIRVLVVDDEKIVRRGLVSFMPWKDFGMTVVGEANNGENALQFIESNKVDLMLTDLSMPVMSGIELMREVRSRFPHIQIVVMTLHQDFVYVQEALRLGAIDYIAKTQLEKEQFEDVLGRISSLLDQKATFFENPFKDRDIEFTDEVLALYALNTQSDEIKVEHFLAEKAAEADIGIWYWTGLHEDEKEVIAKWAAETSTGELALRCFQNLQSMDRKSVLQLLRVYQKRNLFYDFDPLNPYKTVDSREVSNGTAPEGGQDMNTIKEKWLAREWIHNDKGFKDMISELKVMRLPPIRLTRIFFSITDEWNRLYRDLLEKPIVIEDFLSSWDEFEQWIIGTRTIIKSINNRAPFSDEIQNSIMKAMVLAQQMMNEPHTAAGIARKVNMSSSYFSQCFKEIAGQTYTEYVRSIRMDRAKEYLINTKKTIQWIAEQVGYHDEKYFSRLFREQVGMLPSEYRQAIKTVK